MRKTTPQISIRGSAAAGVQQTNEESEKAASKPRVDVASQLRATSLPVLAVLLAVDALLIGTHIIAGLMVLAGQAEQIPRRWHLGADWGLPEIFNYLKWVMLVLVIGIAAAKLKSMLLWTIAVFFLVILLDDSLQFHERAGEFLAPHLDPVLPREWGQLVGSMGFWSLEGGILALLLAFGWFSDDAGSRVAVLPMAVLFGGILACGVVFDFLHWLHPAGLVGAGLGVLEEGGEMVFASILLAYGVGAFWRKSPGDRK